MNFLPMKTFDFDVPTDRSGTHSTRWEKYAGRDVIPLWVADTDYRAPQQVIDVLRLRVEHGVFGYTTPPPELRELIVARLARLYGWKIAPEWIVYVPGVFTSTLPLDVTTAEPKHASSALAPASV